MTRCPILKVCSIGKSGFRFFPDFRFAIKREIEKRISTLRYLFLDFLYTVRLGNPKRDFKLTVLKNSGLARARIITKKGPLFTRTVLQILFRISQSNGREEIHEIWIWISKLKSTLRTDFSKMKSDNGFRVRLQNLKYGFPNRRNLIFSRQAPRKLPLCRRGSVKDFA